MPHFSATVRTASGNGDFSISITNLKNVAAHAAPEAVINLPHRMHAERWRFFLMERAQPSEILPGLFQAHVFADHADDVRLLLHPIRE